MAALMTKCVTATDRCAGSYPCPYCEPVLPLRTINGRFAPLTDINKEQQAAELRSLEGASARSLSDKERIAALEAERWEEQAKAWYEDYQRALASARSAHHAKDAALERAGKAEGALREVVAVSKSGADTISFLVELNAIAKRCAALLQPQEPDHG